MTINPAIWSRGIWRAAMKDGGSLVATKLPHIGIVTEQLTLDAERPLIVHNAGRGPQLEDLLFDYKITGHYRYLPEAVR